jgi:membrane protease YdiL (CAAX protease family)
MEQSRKLILKGSFIETFQQLLKQLFASKILMGYITVGFIASIVTHGFKGVYVCAVNFILLGVYATIIKMTTTNYAPAPIKRPKLETILGAVVFSLFFIISLIFWGLVNIPFLANAYWGFVMNIQKLIKVLNAQGFPNWALGDLKNAIQSTCLNLAPTLFLFILLGYGLKGMSIRFWNLKLILILLAITISLGLPFQLITQKPFYQVIILYLINLFINGIPEELFFRGFFLPRFERVFKNPALALVITSILFSVIHIPSHLNSGASIFLTVANTLSLAQPTGLIWGYLYLRTRSVVPGALWHTANLNLGIIFIS